MPHSAPHADAIFPQAMTGRDLRDFLNALPEQLLALTISLPLTLDTVMVPYGVGGVVAGGVTVDAKAGMIIMEARV